MVSLLVETWRYFASHDGRLLSGAIAFYASLAIAPLGVVALLIASLIMPEADARAELVTQVGAFIGSDLATFLVEAIVQLGDKATSWAAPILGLLFMLYVSTRLFSMLRRALNHMWGIRPKLLVHSSRSEMFHLAERRLLAFAMVLIFGSSLMVLVLLHSVAAVAAHFIGEGRNAVTLIEFGSAFAVLAPLIALVYRWLPDAIISWRDVWVGAAVTCLFVLAGSFLIGILATLADEPGSIGPSLRVFLVVGLLGGFTTFSAFSLESLRLIEDGQLGRALLYIGASGGIAILAAALGVWTARASF